MTQEVRHTTKYNDNSSTETLLAGEIVYTDSGTIKIGDGTKIFSQLPEFSSNDTLGDDSTIKSNSAKKIQAHGTLNKNPSATGDYTKVFDWIGTNQEFVDQQVETLHPDWLCFVTDDISAVSDGTYTRSQIDGFLANKADGQGSAVLTTGSQNIEGFKYFINDGLKSKSSTIDSTQTPAATEYLSMVMAHDKNGQRVGNLEVFHNTDGSIGVGINASVGVGGVNVYSPAIITCISQDGQSGWTYTHTPSSTTANNNEIATTEHVMNVLKAMYPVGAIFLGTTSTCPMAQFFGTWTLVSSGYALWTGNGTAGTGTTANADYANAPANTTIAAGLPNITGSANRDNGYGWIRGTTSGALYGSGTYQRGVGDSSVTAAETLNFDASRSNSTYGQSSTVQPPAYVVNVWRRTA